MRSVRLSVVPILISLLWPIGPISYVGVPCLMAGCTVPDTPPDSQIHDLAPGGNDGGPRGDLISVDLSHPSGTVGRECAMDSDCKLGASPLCWRKNILDTPNMDLPGNLPVPGGYCSSTCNSDSDCGGGLGICQIITDQQTTKYCLESCTDAVTCRHPGFACLGAGNNSGYCWPSTNLVCNPTSSDGSCQSGAGGCIRRAFEDLGECRPTCKVGTGTCQPVVQANRTIAQHCVYINATRDTAGQPTRDKYKGTACFELYDNARAEGTACSYFDECQDGYQCNLSPGGDSKCRQLCVVGAIGACPDPLKCKDVFTAGLGNPGLCVSQ